mgnify:CR=1 FL=1
MEALKVMAWNINQQGRQWRNKQKKDGEIPLWITEQIPNDVNVVVFTEFNCHAENILDFYDALEKQGFSYATTNHSCAWANDVLIAVRGKKAKIDAVTYEKAYPDTHDTNSSIDWDMIPENLRIDISVNGKCVHLWGIRIKDLGGNYQLRKAEMETVMCWLRKVKGTKVLMGDFNNLRENTIEESWNISVLDGLIGSAFERKTPKENHSWGVSLNEDDNSFDGYIKNDHLIHSTDIKKARVEPTYKWDYLVNCEYSLKDAKYGKRALDIKVTHPDHGILFGELII